MRRDNPVEMISYSFNLAKQGIQGDKVAQIGRLVSCRETIFCESAHYTMRHPFLDATLPTCSSLFAIHTSMSLSLCHLYSCPIFIALVLWRCFASFCHICERSSAQLPLGLHRDRRFCALIPPGHGYKNIIISWNRVAQYDCQHREMTKDEAKYHHRIVPEGMELRVGKRKDDCKDRATDVA